MRTSEQIDELAKALAQAQGDFKAVPRQSENPFFNSKYASLPDVVLAASPILATYGLSVTQMPEFDGEHDLLTTRLMHSSGQWIESTMRLYLPKADAQGQGSALTYARRYSYSGALGIVTDADDDGNAAARSAPAAGQRGGRSAVRPPPNGAVASNGHATEKQLALMGRLCGEVGVDFDQWVAKELDRDEANPTTAEASALIEKLYELKKVPA